MLSQDPGFLPLSCEEISRLGWGHVLFWSCSQSPTHTSHWARLPDPMFFPRLPPEYQMGIYEEESANSLFMWCSQQSHHVTLSHDWPLAFRLNARWFLLARLDGGLRHCLPWSVWVNCVHLQGSVSSWNSGNCLPWYCNTLMISRKVLTLLPCSFLFQSGEWYSFQFSIS